MRLAETYVELHVDLPADALAITRRLAQRPDVALLHDTSGVTPNYVACDALEISYDLDPEPELALTPTRPRVFPRWIGVLPYESQRALERGAAQDVRAAPHVCRPEWRRYGAVVEIADKVRILGTDQHCAENLKRHLLGASGAPPAHVGVMERQAEEPVELHLRRITRAMFHIGCGDVYQVNLARRLSFTLEGHACDVLARLLTRTDGPFCAAIALDEVDVIATSPELFLSLDAHGKLLSVPIKGTRPRGRSEAQDEALRAELARDPKEQAELVMVVDVVRNDLGRISTTGSVKLAGGFEVETFRAVHHRGACIRAQLSPRASRKDLFEALLPSGSVTGAPKARAMEIIASLEAHRRGLYTGAFGMIQQDGGVRLGMAIRTLTRRRASLETHYFSGGGIVADSVPAREVEETAWKSSHLAALLD